MSVHAELEADLAARIVGAVDGANVVHVAPELLPRSSADGAVLAGWWSQTERRGQIVHLPNPWDDPVALGRMEPVADDLCLELLEALAAVLGEAHGHRHGPRYWEALLGPLVSFTITAVIDHRLFLRAVAEIAPRAPLLSSGVELVPPPSVWEATNLQLSEAWRLSLTERLAAGAGVVLQPRTTDPDRTQIAASAPVAWTPALLSRAAGVRHLPRMAVGRRAARPRQGRREVALLGQFKLTARQAWSLHRAVPGMAIAPTPPFQPGQETSEHPARAELAGIPLDGELGSAVAELLPALVPRSVLEDYPRLIEQSRRIHGEPCRAVHGNWAFGDLDGEFVGRCIEAGHEVAFAQHGGATYDLEVAPHERHERRLGTAQLSWGRTGGPERNVTSPHVGRLSGRHQGGDRVVVVEGLCPPLTWTFRLTSTPIGDQWLEEEERLVRFAEAVKGAREHLVLRRYPGIAFDGARHPTLEALPTPAGTLPRTATDLMRRSRVAVLAYPDTPFLEAMALGTPVIGVWNPSRWRMRGDARDLFEALRDARITHDDPAGAAAHLDAVYDDPAGWWDSPDLRELRRAFRERFARDGDWLAEWRAVLGGRFG